MSVLNIGPISYTQSSDATFRAWGKAVSDALQAVGLVKTADTGQINWATVPVPPTISTFAGYEIYRFDDAEQAAFPIFIKIQYGVGSAAANSNINVSVGKGTDGAGTLTGVLIAALSLGSGASGALSGFVSKGTGYVAFVATDQLGTTTGNMVFAIDRFRKADGTAATANGTEAGVGMAYMVAANSGARYLSSSYDASQQITATTTDMPWAPAILPGGWAEGGQTFVAPAPHVTKRLRQPSRCWIFGSLTDFAPGAGATVTDVPGFTTVRATGTGQAAGATRQVLLFRND